MIIKSYSGVIRTCLLLFPTKYWQLLENYVPWPVKSPAVSRKIAHLSFFSAFSLFFRQFYNVSHSSGYFLVQSPCYGEFAVLPISDIEHVTENTTWNSTFKGQPRQHAPCWQSGVLTHSLLQGLAYLSADWSLSPCTHNDLNFHPIPLVLLGECCVEYHQLIFSCF